MESLKGTFLLLWPYMKRRNTPTGLAPSVQRNWVATQQDQPPWGGGSSGKHWFPVHLLVLTLLSVAGHSHSCLGRTGLYGSEQNFSPAHCKPPGPQTGTRNALRHRQRNCAFKKLHQSLLVVKLLVFQVSDCLEEFSGYVGDNNMKDPWAWEKTALLSMPESTWMLYHCLTGQWSHGEILEGIVIYKEQVF